RRLEVEEADQVDQQEAAEEEEQHRGGSRYARVRGTAEAVERVDAEEAQRRDVRDRDLAEDVPVHLLEGGAEDRGQEEERDERALSHQRLSRSSANSSTRASRERPPRCSGLR